MTTVTESDIKELKDLIIAFREDANNRFARLEADNLEVKENLIGIDKRLTVIETRLEEWRPSIAKIPDLADKMIEVKTKLSTLEPSIQKLPDLAEKVGELKNWKQIGLVFVTAVVSSIFSGTIGGVIGWLIRR